MVDLLQNGPESSALHHYAVHYGETSLWAHLSKGHCSMSLVTCSDATLQSFIYGEKRLYPDNPFKQSIIVHSFSNRTVMNFNFLT